MRQWLYTDEGIACSIVGGLFILFCTLLYTRKLIQHWIEHPEYWEITRKTPFLAFLYMFLGGLITLVLVGIISLILL